MNEEIRAAMRQTYREMGEAMLKDERRMASFLADILGNRYPGERLLLRQLVQTGLPRMIAEGGVTAENLPDKAAYVAETYLWREDATLAAARVWFETLKGEIEPEDSEEEHCDTATTGDNDNKALQLVENRPNEGDAAPDNAATGIGGKPGYMAPEVVRGERPGTLSDYHSLAVVLFKLFMRHDPLMGRAFVNKVCITEAAEKELYGDRPVFIFDPDDHSNAPLPGVHPNPLALWPRYPGHVRDIFTRAFHEGMKSPNARPSDNDWLEMLVRLRGEIITCNCGRESFASVERERLSGGRFRCGGCGSEISFPLALECGRRAVYLFPGNRLYRCHTEGGDDFATATGQVVRNKKNPGIWALRNLSDQTWQATAPDGGGRQSVAKDAVAPIAPGVGIAFGKANGRIVREDG